MPAKTEVTEQDWGAPQQPHSGDVLGACPHPPPVLRCLWEVASSCRVGGGALLPPNSPHPTPAHLIQCHPFWNKAVWKAGRRDMPRKGGCHGRLQDSICPLPLRGAPLVGPTQGQLQKHPHLPAAMVLLSRPLAQLACLLADGWQGLVAGTIVPTTFLRTQDEGASQPPLPQSLW